MLIIDLAKNYGGADVRVVELARALHGHQPYAVVTLAGSPLHQILQRENLTYLSVPTGRGDPRVLLFLLRAIRREGFAAVDGHNPQSQFWGQLAALLTGNKPMISTVHSSYRIEHSGSLKGWAYEQVLRLNALGGGYFIAVSEAVYDYLRSIGVPKQKISLIQNSLSLPPAAPRKREHPLLESFGWGRDAFIVTVVARLESVKGHTFLLQALKRVVREYPQIRSLIVGEGRMRSALEDEVQQMNLDQHVCFAGFRDDIPALLDASDAFCLPSLSEGLPYALLEACAQRLPLLVTRVGGMAALLTQHQTAYLVPPADPEALAEGLGWLIDHPKEAAEMSQAAFELVSKLPTPAEMVSRTAAVYQRDCLA